MTGRRIVWVVILAAVAAIILAVVLAIGGRGETPPENEPESGITNNGTDISQNRPPEAEESQPNSGGEEPGADVGPDTDDRPGSEPETQPETPPGSEPESEPGPGGAFDPSGPMVALTFDDGPSTATTHLLLDLLEEYGVPASFFLIGRNIDEEDYGDIQRMVALGCEVNSHTWSHTDLTKLTAEEIQEEISKASDAIFAASGVRPAYVRPPYGSIDQTVRDSVGVPLIRWSVDTMDWSSRDPAAILAEVQSSTFDGCIILMHDIYDTTVEACGEAIPWLLSQGYQLVTVSQLLEARGITPEAGQDYRLAKP